METLEMITRLVAAIIAGGVVGVERETSGKPAGLRTYMLVTLGAAAFMVVTMKMYTSIGGGDASQIDPFRVIQGIVGGIGFLGAGSIIEARGAVRGITTAASIWVAAGIGIACGVGYYDVAAASTVCTLIILVVLGPLEKRVFKNKQRPDRD